LSDDNKRLQTELEETGKAAENQMAMVKIQRLNDRGWWRNSGNSAPNWRLHTRI
jgi:hypothetical protein